MNIDTLTKRQILFVVETLKAIRSGKKPTKEDYTETIGLNEMNHLILYLEEWL